MKHLLLPVLSGAMAIIAHAAPPVGSQTANLTIEKLIDIKHPSNPVWSPDGRHVAFIWDRAGISNLYVADASGQSTQPSALTHIIEGSVSSAFWSHDGTVLYFPHQADLWQVSASGGEPRPVWTTPTPETDIVMSPNGKQVAFVRPAASGPAGERGGNDLWVRSLSAGTETRLAHDPAGIGGISWSPDSTRLAYSAGSNTIHHD